MKPLLKFDLSCGWQRFIYNFLGSFQLVITTILRIFLSRFDSVNRFYNARNPADLWLNVGDLKKCSTYLCYPLEKSV